ncbi:hypothetical protein DPMN_187343 [Dreissena polymorpha]|uniref:Uncharacterized protein n=1 Tax=Dreissena polymorpha TaxID=45954 RepID=A0A9D4DN53_DREPO|nr:hypothetical protein DPMN_187343 [Dreissena polymorpha]
MYCIKHLVLPQFKLCKHMNSDRRIGGRNTEFYISDNVSDELVLEGIQRLNLKRSCLKGAVYPGPVLATF